MQTHKRTLAQNTPCPCCSLCLHDDVNVFGSELSVCRHQRKTRTLCQVRVIIRSLCPFEQGVCQGEQEEEDRVYVSAGESQQLPGEGERDAEGPADTHVQPEHTKIRPGSGAKAFVIMI